MIAHSVTSFVHSSALFLQSSRAHRDLHSFPTRRSSDLSASGPASSARPIAAVTIGSRPSACRRGGGSGWAQISRSEEHTSELQSRLHLVCRLLLEKKKKKTQNISKTTAVSEACSVNSDL